ncbi:hypothetical protein Tco_1028385 [Tanacetum coccineum]|uniref:Uncharacterized protein n=1 Tax=Tanacetum coccineum TaxID=301880 RepID=A0ABQ5G0H9_9ASTR
MTKCLIRAYKEPILNRDKICIGIVLLLRCGSSSVFLMLREIAKVAIGGIRYGVCRQSGEERGTLLWVNLAGSGDRGLSLSCVTLVLEVWEWVAPLVLK